MSLFGWMTLDCHPYLAGQREDVVLVDITPPFSRSAKILLVLCCDGPEE